jgi:hypothetical protein
VITLAANGTAVLSRDNQDAFSLPFDAVIENIYMTVNIPALFTFPAGIVVRPFLQLYTAAPDSNTFVSLPATKLSLKTGYSGSVPANTPQSASVQQIGLRLTAGTRLLIGGHMEITGTGSLAHSYLFHFTGGIALRPV